MEENTHACTLTQFLHLHFLHCDPAKNSEIFTEVLLRTGQNGDLVQLFSPPVTSLLLHSDQWSTLVSEEYGNWQQKPYVQDPWPFLFFQPPHLKANQPTIYRQAYSQEHPFTACRPFLVWKLSQDRERTVIFLRCQIPAADKLVLALKMSAFLL